MSRIRSTFRLIATDTGADRSARILFDFMRPGIVVQLAAWMLLGYLVTYPTSVNGQDSADQIKTLIQQLASDEFQQRQSAETQLIELGQAAIPQLQLAMDPQAGLPHSTQVLARRVLTRLLRDQKKAQIESFQKDVDATLPGWEAFASAYGQSPDNRKLYAGIYADAGEIIDAWEAEQRITELGYRLVTRQYRSVTPQHVHGSLPATLFCFTEAFGRSPPPETDRTAHSRWQQVTQTLARESVVEALLQHPQHHLWMSMVERYLVTLPEGYPYSLYRRQLYRAFHDQRLNNALLKDALSEQHAAVLRADFISLLAELGTAETLEQLNPVLRSSALVGQYVHLVSGVDEKPVESVLTVRLGDVALLASILLSDKSPSDFGFPIDAINEEHQIEIKRAGFDTPEERAKAFRAWEADQNQATGPPATVLPPTPSTGPMMFVLHGTSRFHQSGRNPW